jgi:uncharacterized membrane protein YkoI
MKKFWLIPTALIAIGGGFVLAQTQIFTSAEENNAITAAKAKEIALQQFDGKIIEFEYDRDDAVPHYEFEMKTDSEKIEFDVNAATGEVTGIERENLKTVPEKATEMKQEIVRDVTGRDDDDDDDDDVSAQVTPDGNAATTITVDQAIAIAQAKANGTVVETELDNDDGVYLYEIELRNGNVKYEFDIDATTGAILKFEEDLDDND